MPRAYSNDEMARIRQELLSVGRDRFTILGLSKVTVAELATAVAIGKGSFYLFFESKEALFFAIQEADERSFKAAVEAELEPLVQAGDGVALLQTFFLRQSSYLEAHPFLRRLLDPGTVAALARKLPAGIVETHQQGDAAWLGGLQQRWQRAGLLRADIEPQALFAVSAALFALCTAQDLIQPLYSPASAILARALARELAVSPSGSPTAQTPSPGSS